MTLVEPPALGPKTLGRKLVIYVALLVAVGTALVGVFNGIITSKVLGDELDSRLDATVGRVTRDTPDGGGDKIPPGTVAGQQIGTVVIDISSDGTVTSSGIMTEDGWATLSADDVETLSEVHAARGKREISLPDQGLYRVRVDSNPTGGVTIVGLPMASLIETMTTIVVTQSILILALVAISVLIARAIVVRSLRPLNRLASTATSVSQLDLERGEVLIAERIPNADADPTSEVGRVGKAFNLMLDNVESALAARQVSETKVRQFVADASHELRNPLASIRGYAELTRYERDSSSPDVRHALVRIESEADRMSALVNDLLLLARLDSGPAIEPTQVDASEIVLNAVADAQAAGPEHEWTVSVSDEPATLAADANRLHQIVANLLTNARTHTPAGTTIHTAVTSTEQSVEISVTDNGPGIAPEILPQVFERFTRAEASRVRTAGSSTGLGLAIVKAVVKAHDGQVWVDSEQGVRTAFHVLLPRHSSDGPTPLL